jgi:hypothetical protein
MNTNLEFAHRLARQHDLARDRAQQLRSEAIADALGRLTRAMARAGGALTAAIAARVARPAAPRRQRAHC